MSEVSEVQEPTTLREAAETIKVGCGWLAGRIGALEAERDIARQQLRGAVEAIDRANAALVGSQYVGGPTEREAYRIAMEALGPFVTQHQGRGEQKP